MDALFFAQIFLLTLSQRNAQVRIKQKGANTMDNRRHRDID